jgi:hypothetical protein
MKILVDLQYYRAAEQWRKAVVSLQLANRAEGTPHGKRLLRQAVWEAEEANLNVSDPMGGFEWMT